MTGNVFHYTAKGTIASYEKTNDGYETLVREVLSGLNDTIDYTGCTASWWASTLPDLDGEKLRKLSDHTAH